MFIMSKRYMYYPFSMESMEISVSWSKFWFGTEVDETVISPTRKKALNANTNIAENRWVTYWDEATHGRIWSNLSRINSVIVM